MRRSENICGDLYEKRLGDKISYTIYRDVEVD